MKWVWAKVTQSILLIHLPRDLNGGSVGGSMTKQLQQKTLKWREKCQSHIRPAIVSLMGSFCDDEQQRKPSSRLQISVRKLRKPECRRRLSSNFCCWLTKLCFLEFWDNLFDRWAKLLEFKLKLLPMLSAATGKHCWSCSSAQSSN